MTESAASKSIDEMPFGTRARNVLLRNGVKNLAQLSDALKRDRLSSWRGCGSSVEKEIREIARPYLEALPSKVQDSPSSTTQEKPLQTLSTVLGRHLTSAERGYAETIQIEDIDLSNRAKNVLSELGWKTAYTAATGLQSRLADAPNLGKKTLMEIQAAISNLFDGANKVEAWTDESPKGLAKVVVEMLDSVETRQKQILMDRHGLWDGEGDTLEDIAGKLGITRERIRQIQVQAELKLRGRFRRRILAFIHRVRGSFLSQFLDSCDGMATKDDLRDADFNFKNESPEPKLALEFILSAFGIQIEELVAEAPFNSEGIYFSSAEIAADYAAVVAAIKMALIGKGRPVPFDDVLQILKRDPKLKSTSDFLRRCCEVSKEIGVDEAEHVGLRRWPYFNPQYIPEMAQRALVDIGQPAHFTHIVTKMNLLFPKRAPFNVNSVHFILNKNEKVFVGVGRGTYALVNWGMRRPPFIKTFLVQAIREKGGAVKIDDLVAAGIAKYGYKESSLRMTLGMNPKVFKILPDGFCKAI